MIRIAVIGCSNLASEYGAVAARLQGARLAAVVDPDCALARRTARALEAPIWAASLDKLLADNAEALDAVVICRASGPAEALVEQAAAAGKHVLLDMPLMLPTAPGDAPSDACRSAGVALMVGQATRFLPSVMAVKSCLRSEILGAPGFLRIHNWKTPDAGGQAPPGPEHANGAAAIFPAVLPDVDLANWFFESLPTEIYAAGHGPADVEPGSYAYVQVHLGYSGGGMALVDHSTILPRGAGYFSLSLIGSAGAAYADDHNNVHLLYRGGEPVALPAGREKLHHLAQLQEFVGAIETGRRPAITADDGQKAAEVVRAVGRSLESGRAMRLVGSRYELV